VEKPELLKPNAHSSWRNQELFGKWPGEMLKHLVVAAMIEGANRRRDLFINVAWHDDPALAPQQSGIAVASPATLAGPTCAA
jgi:hypothetical protein